MISRHKEDSKKSRLVNDLDKMFSDIEDDSLLLDFAYETLDEDAIDHLTKRLAQSNNVLYIELHMHYCHLTDAAQKKLIRSLEELDRERRGFNIHISGTFTQNEVIKAKSLIKSLTELSIDTSCRLIVYDAVNFFSLNSLLNATQIGLPDIGPAAIHLNDYQDASSLQSAILSLRKIEKLTPLRITHFNMDKLDPNTRQVMIDSLAELLESGNAPSIVTLDLSWVTFHSSLFTLHEITRLLKALRHPNCPIHLSLILNDNKLDFNCVKAIADFLREGNTPEYLQLSLNNCLFDYSDNDNPRANSDNKATLIANALLNTKKPIRTNLSLCDVYSRSVYNLFESVTRDLGKKGMLTHPNFSVRLKKIPHKASEQEQMDILDYLMRHEFESQAHINGTIQLHKHIADSHAVIAACYGWLDGNNILSMLPLDIFKKIVSLAISPKQATELSRVPVPSIQFMHRFFTHQTKKQVEDSASNYRTERALWRRYISDKEQPARTTQLKQKQKRKIFRK